VPGAGRRRRAHLYASLLMNAYSSCSTSAAASPSAAITASTWRESTGMPRRYEGRGARFWGVYRMLLCQHSRQSNRSSWHAQVEQHRCAQAAPNGGCFCAVLRTRYSIPCQAICRGRATKQRLLCGEPRTAETGRPQHTLKSFSSTIQLARLSSVDVTFSKECMSRSVG
jgi:hypothetical protein